MSDEAIANNSEAVAPDSGSESVTDLDSLLSEYDNSATTTTEQATASSGEVDEGDRLRRVETLLETYERRHAKEQYRHGMENTVSMMRNALGVDINADILESYVSNEAKKDERIAQAWIKKDENPNSWKKIVTALAHDFKGKMGDFANFDQQATNNLDAVRASVKSKTETSADHDEKYSLANLNALSEQEFEQRKSSWKG